jgi:hypothetical protein
VAVGLGRTTVGVALALGDAVRLGTWLGTAVMVRVCVTLSDGDPVTVRV